MNKTIQRVCIWSGPVFIVIMLVCLIAMGFLPPPSPAYDAVQIAAIYEENRTLIRAGSTVLMQGSILMLLWVAAISIQLRRVEQGTPILSLVQLICGVCGNFLFTFMAAAWTVAAFRPEREATEIQAWNDFGWFLLIMPVTVLSVQAIAIGVAVLSDVRRQPLFPRWVGYFNFWLALLLLPGSLVTFFKSGPFAYDGILVFWIALTLFPSWSFVMAWSVDRAIRTPDEAPADSDSAA